MITDEDDRQIARALYTVATMFFVLGLSLGYIAARHYYLAAQPAQKQGEPK